MKRDEFLRVIKDEELVWSTDFESIRKPLVKLLETIEQTGSHQFDEQLDEMASALLDY
jgi:hypothetical protein